MEKFKESFEKIAGFRTVVKSVTKAQQHIKPNKAVNKLVEGLNPTEASRRVKQYQHIKKMKASGVTDDQIRATVEKVKASKAAKASRVKEYDAGKMKKEFVAKGKELRKQDLLTKKPGEVSMHTQNKMKNMAPGKQYRAENVGTSFDPRARTPLKPTKTRKPF